QRLDVGGESRGAGVPARHRAGPRLLDRLRLVRLPARERGPVRRGGRRLVTGLRAEPAGAAPRGGPRPRADAGGPAGRRARGFTQCARVGFDGLAHALYALGRPAEALDWLERAYRQRHPELQYLRVQPAAARMRADPRFVEFFRRIRPR